MSVPAAFLRSQIERHCSQIVAVAEKIPAGLAPLRPIGRKGVSFMASIYKRGKVWWIKYHVKGSRVQRSLHTTNDRVARTRRSKLEYDLATNGLIMPSETPLAPFLEDFCRHLRTIRTPKSYKNDVSYLRTFFGPICRSLVPGNTCNKGKTLRKEHPRLQEPLKRRYVRVGLLEEVTSEVISRFITQRIREDGMWRPQLCGVAA
jgi:hypothetical protein